MPDPCIKHANRRWHPGTPHEFELVGANFQQGATVVLQDNRATWKPVPAGDIDVSNDGKRLRFTATVDHLNHGTGTLTITVTNPNGGGSDSTDVNGTYG